MTDFERDRLNQYITDVEKWLLVIADGLRYPETPEQAAAVAMTRAAVELATRIRQQMTIDVKTVG